MQTATVERPKKEARHDKEAKRLVKKLDQLQGDEFDWFREDREKLLRISTREMWPGAAGLGAYFTNADAVNDSVGNHVFLPYQDMRFLPMITIPAGQYEGIENRDVRLAFLCKPTVQHGAPTISVQHHELMWDDRQMGFDQMQVGRGKSKRIVTAGVGEHYLTLNTRQHPQVFALSNRVRSSMIAAGFKFRSTWRKKAKSGDDQLRWGEDSFRTDEQLRDPEQFMPVPYCEIGPEWDHKSLAQELIVGSNLRKLFIPDVEGDLRVRAPVAGEFLGAIEDPGPDYLPLPIERKRVQWYAIMQEDGEPFCFPLLDKQGTVSRDRHTQVRVGDDLGYATQRLPRRWQRTRGIDNKFDELERYGFGEKVLAFQIAAWMLRQVRMIDGRRCIPFSVVSELATKPGMTDRFPLAYWDVAIGDQAIGTELDCFNTSVQGWVYPTISMRGWTDFHHDIGHGVTLNLEPLDPRLRFPKKKAARKGRRRKNTR